MARCAKKMNTIGQKTVLARLDIAGLLRCAAVVDTNPNDLCSVIPSHFVDDVPRIVIISAAISAIKSTRASGLSTRHTQKLP